MSKKESIDLKYKQQNIYDALVITQIMPQAPAVEPAVDPRGIAQAATASAASDDIVFYVSTLPASCYICPCSRTWETKEGRVIKCRISGEYDLAEIEGKRERRADCPLRVLSHGQAR